MKLKDLAAIVNGVTPAVEAVEITGISSDSRNIKTGYLFAALKGTKNNGAGFIADAVNNGASAVLVSADMASEDVGVPVVYSDEPRRALALAAAAFYGQQPEVITAVTGTSGKTSVVSFTRQIWAYAGFAAASIGTTGVESPFRNDYGTLTTPDPVALQQLLAELAQEGVTHAAMEASSHGLDQCRLDGVHLTAGAFTNLGRDHMDYHPTIEDYLAAKMRLFDTLLPQGSPAIMFADDVYSEAAIAAVTKAGCDILTVGRKGTFITLKRVEHERHRQYVELMHENNIYEVILPLAGDFQVANAIVAAGLAIVSGVPAEAAFRALERLKGASGRLELVGSTHDGVPIYVDYAHKPDALENVLASVRPFTTGRVIVVFGCGGDRDKGKRPIMGEIASRLADVVIISDDNPRSEDPATIRAEILTAAPNAIEIGDRHEAISQAILMAAAGDTVIIAGKGHEEGQTINGVTLPFSDHAEVIRALEVRA